jgi:hypothetical protein
VATSEGVKTTPHGTKNGVIIVSAIVCEKQWFAANKPLLTKARKRKKDVEKKTRLNVPPVPTQCGSDPVIPVLISRVPDSAVPGTAVRPLFTGNLLPIGVI